MSNEFLDYNEYEDSSTAHDIMAVLSRFNAPGSPQRFPVLVTVYTNYYDPLDEEVRRQYQADLVHIDGEFFLENSASETSSDSYSFQAFANGKVSPSAPLTGRINYLYRRTWKFMEPVNEI